METTREIEAGITQHFSEILNEDGGDRGRDIGKITILIPRAVSGENNEMLTKPLVMQEVEEVVNQIALGKSLGLDGFTSNFFHYFFDLVKEEFLDIMEESRNKRGVLKSFNATFLTLIPKEAGADGTNKF